MSFRPRLRTSLGVGMALLATAVGPLHAGDARLFDVRWLGFDASDYNTARYTYASCAADLDRDGDPDVALASWPNIARVTVARNLGAGQYAPPDVYSLPRASYEIIAADVTGDGFAELVAANTDANWNGTSVSVFRNRGDATFDPAQVVPCGGTPVGLAAADFDGDGDRDLAVANWGFLGSGSTVSLLRNQGAGTFAAPESFAAGSAPFRLVAADLDGDGRMDLAVSNGKPNAGNTAALNVLLNNGSGGFQGPITLSGFFDGISFFPTVAAGDSDADGLVDLFYSDNHVGGVVLLRNLGGGTFAPAVTLPLPAFAGGVSSLALADVTGDGWLDVLGGNLDNEGWSLIPGAGSGTFGTATRFPSGEAPVDVEVADVDGDGDLDPIVACRDSLEFAVNLNPGDGDFSPPAQHPVDLFSDFFDHGDIDGDGDLDVVSGGGAALEILRNQGDGTLAPKVSFGVPGPPLDVKLRDLDADGDLDVIWNEASPPYRWGSAVNDGSGTFTNAVMWPVPTCGYFKAEIEAVDLDHDLDLDVVQIENLGCVNDPFSSRRVFVNENVDGQSFQLSSVLVINVGPRSVASGDLNGDGHVDLAVTGQPTTILLGNGDLTFQMLSAASVPGINVALDDLDLDGRLDLVLALQRNVAPFIESIVVQLGNGDGTFQPGTTYLGSHSPDLAQISEVLTGDPDQDGDRDVLALNYASSDVSFWANDGSGTFAPQVRYGAGQNGLDFSLADFTGDGIADLASYHSGFPPLNQSIVVFPGKGAPPVNQPNVGFAGPGSAFLSVCGQPLSAGNAAELLLANAPAHALAFLVVGLQSNPTPFRGGTWVPLPPVALIPARTDPQGKILAGLAGGGGPVDLFLQFLIADPGQPQGIAFSNGVQVEFLP